MNSGNMSFIYYDLIYLICTNSRVGISKFRGCSCLLLTMTTVLERSYCNSEIDSESKSCSNSNINSAHLSNPRDSGIGNHLNVWVGSTPHAGTRSVDRVKSAASARWMGPPRRTDLHTRDRIDTCIRPRSPHRWLRSAKKHKEAHLYSSTHKRDIEGPKISRTPGVG